MKQTELNDYEKERLEELQHHNYCNSGVFCDVALVDKLKEVGV